VKTKGVILKLPSLREIRESRGLSQSELAREAHVSRDSISNYETGQREAWPATAKRLAEALDVEIADLRQIEKPALMGKDEASGTRRPKTRRKTSIPGINIPRINSVESRGRKPETYYEQEEEIASFPYTDETRAVAFEAAQRAAADARPHYDAVVSGDARFVVEDDGERVAVYLEVPIVDADTALGILRGGTDRPTADRTSEQSQEASAPTKNDDS
jgi:transcriptional regulator with XRE-family HTH domain